MLDSYFWPLGPFRFPEYAERQCYMHEFDASFITMPHGYRGYQRPVAAMLDAIGLYEGTVFMTVDEKIIQPGMSQRRPGPHVDGCFMKSNHPDVPDGGDDDDRDATVDDLRGKGIFKDMSDAQIDSFLNGPYGFNGGGWGHSGGAGGFWNHNCNKLPIPRMPVIVAASVVGCKAWIGQFDAEPRNEGDLSHISDQLGEGTILMANTGYALSPDCIHESMIFDKPTKRQFVRLALPVGTEI